MSIAEIAARSGVHPTSIYRRWGTAEALALDVAAARLEVDLPIPDTGTLRGDLLAYATQAADELNRPDGLWLLQALLAARSTREGTDLRSNLQSRGEQIQNMLDRAGKREEPELHFTDVIDGVLGPIYMRSLFEISGVDKWYLAALVDRTISAPVRISETSPAPSTPYIDHLDTKCHLRLPRRLSQIVEVGVCSTWAVRMRSHPHRNPFVGHSHRHQRRGRSGRARGRDAARGPRLDRRSAMDHGYLGS